MVRCAACGKLIELGQAAYVMSNFVCRNCKELLERADRHCERCGVECNSLSDLKQVIGRNGRARFFCRECSEVMERILVSIGPESIGIFNCADEMSVEIECWKAILDVYEEAAG